MAQLVGCWTNNPRVVCSIPGDSDCFMWDNIHGQDVNLDCASLHPGVMGTWLLVGSSCMRCIVAATSMFPEGTETDNMCDKVLKPRPGCNCKVE